MKCLSYPPAAFVRVIEPVKGRSWLKRVSACSNLKPISTRLQQWNEAVLFSTCLCCCSLIDTALWSGRVISPLIQSEACHLPADARSLMQSPPVLRGQVHEASAQNFARFRQSQDPLSSHVKSTFPANTAKRQQKQNRPNFRAMLLFISRRRETCQEFTGVLFCSEQPKGWF